MKLLTFTIASMAMIAGAASGQIGYPLQQCTAKYGPVVDKWSREVSCLSNVGRSVYPSDLKMIAPSLSSVQSLVANARF